MVGAIWKGRWIGAHQFLCLVLAVLAIGFEHLGPRQAYVLMKPLTTLCIMLPLFFLSAGGDGTLSRFRKGMLLGLCCCLLGDVLLLYEAYFVHGLASFLVGHLLFALSFIRLRGFHAHWISFLFFFGVGTALFLWLNPDLGAFRLPVALYVLVICFMAWQGMGLFLREPTKAFGWIALGVLLFMFSDTLIAISKFKVPFHLSGPLILGTYWLSLGLLSNAARRVVSRVGEG